MVEAGRFIWELSKKFVTPDFLARQVAIYDTSLKKLLGAIEASRKAELALTSGEIKLAHRYDSLYYDGLKPNMTDEDEQILINQISAQYPDAREAYEKREKLFDEAFRPLESSDSVRGEVVG